MFILKVAMSAARQEAFAVVLCLTNVMVEAGITKFHAVLVMTFAVCLQVSQLRSVGLPERQLRCQ